MFTETNPDKGTETAAEEVMKPEIVEFTETNPDKGTETLYWLLICIFLFHRLQKLTPIRGRKL